METNYVYDYGNIDEAIINYAGAAIYDDGSLAQPSAGPVSDQANHELPVEDYHGEVDFSNLLSPLHDVDGLPEDFEFSLQDTTVSRDESGPWHPARARGTPERDLQPKESLAPSSQRDEPSNGRCRACEDRDAHSSTNGISEWPDFSMGDDLPECSCTHPPTDSTPPTSPSSSVQLVGGGLSQSLSPATSMSERDTRAEVAHAETAVNESSTGLSTESTESVGRRDPPDVGTPVESSTPEESASNVNASPPNNASAARPYLCSFCAKSFMTTADVRHHEQLHDPDKQSAQRCPECDYTCRHLKDMRRHQGTHLADPDKYRHRCPKADCSRSFTRKDNAMRHAKRDHTPGI